MNETNKSARMARLLDSLAVAIKENVRHVAANDQ